ncbi:Double-stranded RNA-binding protein 6 [Ranunculus cassubicifolius]
MYKNQLQELAQRSCFNLPWYSCIREGPDHAPRFKATVNFNGEVFESPNFCTTLRQAEHSAAEVALNSLSNRNRGPSHSLAARILDETGVYKNLLQEVSQRVGAALPQYTTVRSGLGHLPVFTCTVDLAGITFTGEPAKNKKQAEKNAAMAAWSSLKQLVKQVPSSSSDNAADNNDEQEQVTIARALLNYRLKEKMANVASPFPKKFPVQHGRPLGAPQSPQISTSKILPLIRPKSAQQRLRPPSTTLENDNESWRMRLHSLFPVVDATPYVPIRQFRPPYHGMAPPVTMRSAVPVFSAPPVANHMAPPVHIREALPVFSAPPLPVKIHQLKHEAPLLPPVKAPPLPLVVIPPAPELVTVFGDQEDHPVAEPHKTLSSCAQQVVVVAEEIANKTTKDLLQQTAPALNLCLDAEDVRKSGDDIEPGVVHGLKKLEI